MDNLNDILEKIEKEKQVKILYACETGSRAWGFPSPDSDYDIRFIYIHERDWYLSLSQRKDTIELINGDLDITGWDLKKSLTLLKRSNAPLIERFQSPIEYYAMPGFKHEFKDLIVSYYSPIGVFYHHYSLVLKFWEEIKNQKEVKLKSMFYLLRSLLSCNWIIQNNNVPPMDISGLMKYIRTDQKEKLNELIALKATVGEKYLYANDKILTNWIVEWLKKAESKKDNLFINKTEMTSLNFFFLKMLYATDGREYKK